MQFEIAYWGGENPNFSKFDLENEKNTATY